jgi:gingipain R
MIKQATHENGRRGDGRTAAGRTLSVSVLLGALLASVAAAADPVEVEVLRSDGDGILLEYRVNGFFLEPVDAGGVAASLVVIGDEPATLAAGEPELPRIARSVAIPADRRMALRVVHAEHEELCDVDIAPSKGNLLRTVDPADVPFEWGPAYELDAFLPEALVETGAPYILRDVRGMVVTLHPARYNPASRCLRVYRRVVVELVPDGPDDVNALDETRTHPSAAFESIYRAHFVNRAPDLPQPYPPVTDEGSMLVICHDEWMSNMQPFANHKNSIGIPTTIVGVSTIGNSPTTIKSYIQSAYSTSDIAFVLLVGDGAQVGVPTASGGSSDPTYSKLAGNDDYPDVLVGRFSAQTAADVDTQVQRTIAYETLPATTQDWFRKGVGIGSEEGPGDDNEMDDEHIDVIRDKLLAAGYDEVDQIYDPGASATAVSTAVNQGRGIINYCGHGWDQGWGTTGFSNTNVSALVNTGKLPFIFSVACVNGNFTSSTCFAEAWLRASSGGQPTGAVGMYASSINQSWNPPMAAQDESNELLLAEAHFAFGALCYAGSALMMDEYGADGVAMFDTWHVFGDPSVRVVGVAEPPSGLVVDPAGGQGFTGNAGGPFSPASVTYTLTNKGDGSIGFSVTVGEGWLAADPVSGTLAGGGSAHVTVTPTAEAASQGNGHYDAVVEFVNTTDGEGDAERTVTLDVGVPEAQYEWPLDEDPGWEADPDWAFGVPQGQGGEHGAPDPTGGHTGQNVYGYNLAGDYLPNTPERHLTTEPIDCSELTEVSLRFWRWLGVEQPQYDHAWLRASTDGTNWQTVWENPGEVADAEWTQVEYDLSAIADGQATVYLRWTMGATDAGWFFCGWNIDDIEIWGVAEPECVDADGDEHLPLYCDGDDCDDTDPDVNPAADEICDDGIDNDCDGLTDDDDTLCTDPDTDGGVPFNPGDSGCGCDAAGGPSRGLLGAILSGLLG